MGSNAGQLTFLIHTALHKEVCLSLLPLSVLHAHTHVHTCARAPSSVLSIPVLFVLFVGVCLGQPLCALQGIGAKSLLSELSARMETHSQITRGVTRTCARECVCAFSFRHTRMNHKALPVQQQPSSCLRASGACRSHDREIARNYCNLALLWKSKKWSEGSEAGTRPRAGAA